MSVEHLNAEENAAFSHILCKSRPPQGSASGGHTAYRHYAQTDTPHFPCLTAHATKIPGLVFVSGQTPIDGAGNLVQGSIQDKTEAVLKNVGNVLKAAGTAWEKVVKVNVYLKNMDDFAEMNKVYEKLVPAPKPARTCIQAAKLPNDVDVEIEAIAAV
ncbi:hypothetical protein FA13DRAFT_1728886 [Coprinellus micaceus]|uniref:Uncharacterized protein n=1 Tax=Coprinellus micaceus TaxID=71717 RepID=A0A4Y7TLN1_COPMI|nr:hypothetical protein FA13DRAFT_1728886 [Coprinellus micaceus]